MRATGSRAYAYARARAWKSRLRTRAEIVALLALTDPERIRRSIEPPFEQWIRIYESMLRSNRAAVPLLRALLRLHEIENVKLLWRSVVNRRHFDSRLWIQLGTLSTLPMTTTATTPRQLAEALAKTPYGSIAGDIARAHADDLQSAELAFDRWASRQLLDEARKMPTREALARQLIEAVVARHDSEIVKRGEKYYGLHTGRASRPDRPKPIRDLCRRAFRGDPFALAPIVALILLAESEVRTVRAIVEREGDPSLDVALERIS